MTSSPLLLPAQPSCRHRRAPCRWEWIRKYCRTTTSLFILLSLIPCLPCAAVLHRSPTKKGVSSQAHQVHLPPIQQSYCWNEYEDLPSRAIASPVVVRGLCMVIYSRGSLAQVNATFYVTDVLKAPPLMKEYLEENPKVQLNFGLLEEWTGFPETADDVEQENLLRGQTCALQRVDLQREYLLFLRPRFLPTGRGEFPRGHGADSEVGTLDGESGGPQWISGNSPRLESWSVFAAPEMATPTAVESVQKGLRQGQ
ncbi:hypothetical protein BV898_15497 [Hypsibius exemplaris]|uniref:Uncharacterized protein n=1 Tax=Hypsibius exemplaris TaxID=2072580 RepID=A0A9X6NB51_HYPEX|nr:hypothetical protein BV898_15497 [Hypsibius exemplaris]